MFTSIVVALDLEATGDRALPFAASLAALGELDVELLTVSSIGMPTAVDSFELERRASAHRLVDYSCAVLRADDAGATIVEYLASRPGALLAMGTTAKGPVAGHLFGSVSEHVLGHIASPVLVAGPRTAGHRLVSPTMIACVGDSDRVEAAAPPIVSWLRTFGGEACVATVQPSGASGDIVDARERVRQLAERLTAIGAGHPAQRILRGDDPVASLEDLAHGFADPVFAAVSARWTDGRFHRHSVTRNLVRHSTWPVLVVPAQPAIADQTPTQHLDAAC